ncbi:MAG: hypothetical protein ACYTG7_14220 [Planctomycetota bacterium]|jgi:sugar phosphate isomerase/epimerase
MFSMELSRNSIADQCAMTIRVESHESGFSSSWLGERAGQAEAIRNAAQDLGLYQVKIGPAWGLDVPHRLAQYLKSNKIKILAVQNVVSPLSGPGEERFGEGLADPRKEVRQKAFQIARDTARTARELGVDKVILRLGSMNVDRLKEIDEAVQKCYSEQGLTSEVRGLLAEGQILYMKNLEPYLDRIVRILHALHKTEPELTFCIETGCRIHELPDLQGLGYIFEDLKSQRIAYWHHTFHGFYQESLGMVSEGAWLGEFSDRTAGIHLHDANGIQGFLPPGIGEVNFRLLRSSLPSTAARVVDLLPSCSADAFRMGLLELRRVGF